MNLLPSDYQLVDVTSLSLHPDNARKGNIERLEESIKVNGFYGALVVQRSTNHIVVGNHRYQAAVNLGLSELPVLFVDVDDNEARRLLLVDNRSNDLASYDDQMLLELLKLTQDETGLDGTGYTDVDLADLERLIATGPTGFAGTDDYPDLLEDDDADDNGEGNNVPFDLIDSTIDEPEFQPEVGTVWQVGTHIMFVGDVMKDWPVWSKYLKDGDWFVPYPSFFVPLAAKPSPRLIMVQPDRYMAGLLLEKWNGAMPKAEQIEP